MIERIRYESGRALRLSSQVALAALVLLCCLGCVTSTPDRGDAVERRDVVSTAVAATLTGVAVATPTPRGFVLELATPDNAERAQRTAYAKQAPHSYATSASRWVHIDGTIEDGSILPVINIWSNYQTRSWLCRLPHGTRVQMVRRVGDGVEIICPSGKKGWVTYWFIKELQ